MTKITLPFNTLLEKDIVSSKINFTINVYNKNKTIKDVLGFSKSFSIDEIFETVKAKYPNKNFEIDLIINA